MNFSTQPAAGIVWIQADIIIRQNLINAMIVMADPAGPENIFDQDLHEYDQGKQGLISTEVVPQDRDDIADIIGIDIKVSHEADVSAAAKDDSLRLHVFLDSC